MIENDPHSNIITKKISPILLSNQEQLKSIEPFTLSPIPLNNNNNNNSSDEEDDEKSVIVNSVTQVQLPPHIKSISGQQQQQQDDDTDEVLAISSIQGYTQSVYKEILYWISVILTCGIALLVYYWFQIFYINCRYKKCELSRAKYLLIESKDQRFEICPVQTSTDNISTNSSSYVLYRFSKFFYNPDTNNFEKSSIQNSHKKSDLITLVKQGLGNEEVSDLKNLFNENVIKIPLKSIPRLFLEEILHPFFIFQIYSVCLWFSEEYYYYAIAIFIIASVSAILNLREIRQNLLSLERIAYFSCPVEVLRNGQFETVFSIDLVPGDIIKLKQSFTLPCDLTLLTGSVILNEAMLTGESIPVTKYSILPPDLSTSVPEETYNFKAEKRSLLFGGTVIVKLLSHGSDTEVLGMVRETGFQTTKGKLILSIMYPKKSHFKFLSEAMKFIGVLCSIAMIGFAISVWRLYSLGEEGKTIALRALDLITIVIPPALPMAMSVGTGFALGRLKKQQVFCISPNRLNMGGKIQVFCFDKTGTLTEEGLDLFGLLLSNGGSVGNCQFQSMHKSEDITNEQCLNSNPLMKLVMSSCHSLSNIDEKVSGDPLEVKIFQVTNSIIRDESISENHIEMENRKKIYFLERFDFQSKLQRMSVVIKTEDDSHYSLVKGSPEIIKQLCLNETIPLDYDQKLSEFTEKGYRVLSCAYRSVTPLELSQYANRDQLRLQTELNLHFLGFIIMENKMKPESPGIIATLQKANIKTVMVTGDNPLTALSVAHQSGIIKKEQSILFMGVVEQDYINWELVSKDKGDYHRLDPSTLLLDSEEFSDYNLIVTGPVFKKLYHNYLQTGSQKFNNMLKRGVVYARMTPDEKQTLVEELERIGLYVGMCGDGANDCGALKAAHVGISLSETEASIAAPFTSTITNISCCPTLIKEGRASLAVSFKLFQFMGMYSLIQFTSVIFLYFIGSVLGNWMYLYQDLWIIFPLVIFMGMTRPSTKLSIKRPSGRLISGAIVGSLIVHILVCISFQMAVFFLIRSRPWYNDTQIDDENIFTYVTTSLFIFGSFQYLIMAFTFSHGKPFLKPLYTNRFLFGTYLIALFTTLLLLFLPTQKVWTFAQLVILPVSFRLIMFAMVIANLLANILVEFLFYYYKTISKKKKVQNPTLIFSKDIPRDNRITEHTVLLPIS
ncbi:P-type ATPase [Tieghemostelium lacteum]|uniref:Cation-transporting ATPase n=1 Tax=Tieghemostelium lacteum TaxID=361077 RepID=A0A152A4B8_TIELA|nr:P-type ATPase [Tieghemostelium lacteum]|eukprot:KYR01086.1 P-type ATPase [Tieghemostelium lacteum]